MKNIIFILLICLLQTTFVNGQGNDPEKKLNAAIYEEEINGNLQEAIALYEEIVKNFPDDRPVVAEALYRNGLANEKLGNLKAMQYYENVINNYTDQPELVKLAQTRLNRMLKTEKPTDAQLASLRLEGPSIIKLYEKGTSIMKGTMLYNSSLSSDGTKMTGIAYSIGQNVAVYDLKTKKIQEITKYEWLSEPFGGTYFPAWSFDGKEIVYMFADYNENYELQVTNLEGKIRTLLKNEPNAGQIIPRQWSRDGSSILTFKQDSSGFYTIGLVSAKNGSFKPLHRTQWKAKFIEGDASLSPDGKFVVFSDGQADKLDLFIMDTQGGEPTLLSDHPTNELNPLWSPDGKHIVFIRKTFGGSLLYAIEMEEGKPVGQAFLLKEGMQNVNLINWAINGINYDVSLDINDVYTLALNPETGIPTEKPKPLDYTPTGFNFSPVWSHNGKYLAFISSRDRHEVVILPVDGGKEQHYTIPNSEEFWKFSASGLRWLPDNSGIGFSAVGSMGKCSVYRLDLISGTWKNWKLPVQGWTTMDWGPDKNSFVYAGWGNIIWDVNSETNGLHQLNTKTGESHNIYQPDPDTWYNFRALKFSPDYKKLTFIFQNKKLMVLDLETGESKTFGENYWSSSFSPNGKKLLAFGSFKNTKSTGIVVFSIDGKIIQQYDLGKDFTSGTRFFGVDWSSNGKQLVFSTRNMKFETYLMKNVLK